MLVELTVENLAIIERAQLQLASGLTVLTGETGAGKSLLIDALELALGERADTDLVRTGATKASVSAVFDLTERTTVAAQVEEAGFLSDEGTLFIQRDVLAEGKSQSRIAGRMAPVAVLKSIGQSLIDLHGQHEHQQLLHPERHLGYLDSYIGAPAQTVLAKLQEEYRAVSDLKRKIAALRTNRRDREQRLDLLRYQVEEISAADPQKGEMEGLESQLGKLKYAEKLGEACFLAQELLQQGEGSALEKLGASVKALGDVTRFDEQLGEALEPIQTALYQLEEGVETLRHYAENLESDPARLEEVAGRMDLLRRLRKKYGDDEAAVLEFLAEAQSELELLEDSESSEEELAVALAETEAKLTAICEELTQIRTQGATEFQARVETELHSLAMLSSRFIVSVAPKPVDATGADQVEFFFSANSGEAARAFTKIASGGEISRVMLALKSVLAGRAGVPTLIFDEVDTGLGGKAAAVMGRKLEELSEHYQVLVISHLPQIASRADHHFRIEKNERGGRVVTEVRELTQEERVEEIARMLAGEEVTENALANARELLALGR